MKVDIILNTKDVEIISIDNMRGTEIQFHEETTIFLPDKLLVKIARLRDYLSEENEHSECDCDGCS